MITRQQLPWYLVGALFVAVTVVALVKTWPILFPAPDISLPLQTDCDLRAGPCRSTLPSGDTLTFSIEPRDIPVMQKLKLEVVLDGIQVDEVQVDLNGVDMNMGFNRSQLKQLSAGHYVGEAIIPVCILDQMEWEARVLAKTDGGLVSAPYRFMTYR